MLALASLLMLAVPEPGGPARARALEPIANWFSDRDYPVEAIQRRAEGVTRFRLVIDKRGNVESCAIEESAGDPALDAATCSILSIRGRFEPARDARGNTTTDRVRARVRWVLPDEQFPALLFEPTRVVTSIRTTADGEATCSTNNLNDMNQSGTPGECGMFTGSGAAERMRAAGIEARLTGVFEIVPQPGAAQSAGPDYGATLFESEIELNVARDGRVSGCRSVRYRITPLPGTASLPTPPDPCLAPPPADQPMFEAADDSGEPRRVRLLTTIYFRAGPTP